MNGLDLAKTVRERWPGDGVVVTSGRARPDPGDLSEKVAFLPKPYRPDSVIDVVRRLTAPQAVGMSSASA
jgi:two-component system, response regulator PdtaR